MALNVSVEPKEDRQLTLTIQVEQARVDQELRKAARKVAGQYRVPGFRPGKAPYSVLVQYVGLPTLFNEFIEPLGEELYKQALEQEGIEPYAQAALDVSSLEPLTYELIVPLEPEIDLGDYRALRVDATPVEIDDAAIDEELAKLQEEHAEWQDVSRASQWGDTLVIDVKSVIVPGADSAEGEVAEDAAEETVVLDETEWEVTLDQENPLEPQGFDDELLGLSADEEKEFFLTWPEDSRSIYKGKQARFQVKVHNVQGQDAPALDDEFAQLIGPDFQTLDDLKNHLRETLQAQRKDEAEQEFLTTALDKLVEQSTLVYPPVVVEDQIDSMLEDFERQLRQFGMDGLEAFLSRTGDTVENYRDGLRPDAEVAARRSLVISELYRLEGIEVTEAELEERIDAMLGTPGDPADPDADDFAELDELAIPEGELDRDATAEPTVEDEVEADVDAEIVAEGETETDAEADEESDVSAQPDAQTVAFRSMMLQGPGRQILESQILQQKALDRLRAIAAGEEVPPVPEKKDPAAAGDSATDDGSTEDAATEDAATEEADESEAAA
ncbi:MAG: trigger factor [Litorilinea sp.]